MPGKQELISGIKEQGARARKIASQLSAEDWQLGVHEAGWTVKQAFCHLASTAAGVSFIVALANQAPAEGEGGGAAFDINEFNKHQVGLRAGKEPEEIVSELQQGIATSLRALEGLDDSAFAREMTSPFTGQPDTLGNVVGVAMVGHYQGHLDEIATITGHS